MRKFCILLLLLLPAFLTRAQSTFYNTQQVQRIEIYFSASNWDYQLDTIKGGQGGYLMADSVRVNGVVYDSVGVKYKGNSSYDSTYAKNPMHIRLDKYKSHAYQGIKDIKLANIYADPSMVREASTYTLLKNYADVPSVGFVELYVNNRRIGLFTNTEAIDDRFLGDNFALATNTLMKCNPQNPGPAHRSTLKYKGADSTLYFADYELDSKYGWKEFVSYMNRLANDSSNIESVLDVDRALWMLAFNNVFVNLDSYTGAFAQNHYQYKDKNGRFCPLIWDLNMSLGGFPYLGNAAGGMGTLTVAGMEAMPLLAHKQDKEWVLIYDLLKQPKYERQYVAHVKTMLEEQLAQGQCGALAQSLQAMIDSCVARDSNSFFTYSQFQNSLYSGFTVGSHVVPGVQSFLANRYAYLSADTMINKVAPVLSMGTAVSVDSLYGQLVTMRVKSNELNAPVYAGYRFNHHDKFAKVLLLDDGMHGDGVAGDSIFGGSVVMNGIAMEYYFIADNGSAVRFLPARAEHEFFNFECKKRSAENGGVSINEFLANNNNLQKDEYSEREDWIELYNYSNELVDLGGCYLSDSTNFHTKWQIPAGTGIAPNSYLIIWADADRFQKTLHSNFKLSNDSGVLYLISPLGFIMDSVRYGMQAADISYGRYPNGTGPFTSMNVTFAAPNNNFGLGVSAVITNGWNLVPNPSNGICRVVGLKSIGASYKVMDVMGREYARGVYNGGELLLPKLSAGIYLVQVKDGNMYREQKLVVQED
jgi:spore coat protein CotH